MPGALEQIIDWYPSGPEGKAPPPGNSRLSMNEMDAMFWAVPMTMVAHENMAMEYNTSPHLTHSLLRLAEQSSATIHWKNSMTRIP